MPITRVPVVHKFGIISHSQRLELQERLLRQTYLQREKNKLGHTKQRNPLEVSEEFIQNFNNAETFEEKEKYEDLARKMVERAKRRAGLRDGGIGHHVNLPLAWTELAQIAQCRGKIQEDCLDVLIVSLDVSPLAKYHIPALFFLAETVLYWLRTDAVHQPYLRTGEIKFLKMGQLVFQRLFYHHMAGHLQGHLEFKNRLYTYTDGLADCQEAYNPYPNALLSMRFIIEVSKIILADTLVEPGEVKEGDNLPKSLGEGDNLPKSPVHKVQELETKNKDTYKFEEQESTVASSHSHAISSSVHDLSPTLWHSLDVWRCTNSLSGGFTDALKALARCGLGLAEETWVDEVIALNILSETAKSSLSVLHILHDLAMGIKMKEDCTIPPFNTCSETSTINSEAETLVRHHNSLETSHSASPSSSISSLSELFQHSDEGDAYVESRTSLEAEDASLLTKVHGHDTIAQESTVLQKEDFLKPLDYVTTKLRPALKEKFGGQKIIKSREVSFDETSIVAGNQNDNGDKSLLNRQLYQGHRSVRAEQVKQPSAEDSHLSTQSSHGSEQKALNSPEGEHDGSKTFYKPEVGSDGFTNRSDASSILTFTNLPQPTISGINGWHWEVAFTYTDILADVCIFGKTADIQKTALVGASTSILGSVPYTAAKFQLPTAGLLGLVDFHAWKESKDGGPNDWSWRVRYGAIQALVRVCKSLEGIKQREGLHMAAWNTLLRAQSSEKDNRVLEALRVGQVYTDIKILLGADSLEKCTFLGSHIASGLSIIYLPPLPPPVELSELKLQHTAQKHTSRKPNLSKHSTQRQPLRTSLKEEIDFASSLYVPPVDYNTRTTFDLRRIVEDQWRKELQRRLEADEAERKRNLELKQKEEEAHQKAVEENRAQKLRGKNKVAAPRTKLQV